MDTPDERYHVIQLYDIDRVLVFDTTRTKPAESVVNAVLGKADFDAALSRALTAWESEIRYTHPNEPLTWEFFFQTGERHLNNEGIYLSSITRNSGADFHPDAPAKLGNGDYYEQLTLPTI